MQDRRSQCLQHKSAHVSSRWHALASQLVSSHLSNASVMHCRDLGGMDISPSRETDAGWSDHGTESATL